MAGLRLKGFKLEYIRKNKGSEAALEYAKETGIKWAKFTVNIIGLNINVVGKENLIDGPVVFIGNHTSILDIPILIDVTDRAIGFIAKKELLKTPVIGYWMQQVHCVALDRENIREAIKVIQEGCNNLKEGHIMGIFPEGTRSKDGKLGEFKGGSFKLATKAKVPVIPVAVDGAYRAFEIDRKFKPIDITVTIGKPIYTDNLTKEEEKALPQKVRSIVADALGQE